MSWDAERRADMLADELIVREAMAANNTAVVLDIERKQWEVHHSAGGVQCYGIDTASGQIIERIELGA